MSPVPRPATYEPLPFTDFARDVLGLKLTRGQRVLAQVAFDGVNPSELHDAEDFAIAVKMFGGIDTIPSSARGLTVLRLGRDSGKSLLVAARAVYRMATAEIGECGPGTMPGVVVISTKRGKGAATEGGSSRIVTAVALSLARAHPYLRARVRNATADGFILERPDGRLVSFLSVPKSRDGAAFRGISIIEAIFDESEFIAATGGDAAISDSVMIAAIWPRLMEGGTIILSSTPWPAPSATATAFDDNFGRPTDAVAARAGTLVMRDGDPRIAAKMAKLRAKPGGEELVMREFECMVVDGGGTFFEASTIDAAVNQAAVDASEGEPHSGIDLAFVRDSSAHVGVRKIEVEDAEGNVRDGIAVVHVDLVSPEKGKPLKPSAVIERFAGAARILGAPAMCGDQHYIETAREHAAELDVGIVAGPTVLTDAFIRVRDLFREGRIVLPSDKRLVEQLKSVRVVAQSGGTLKIVLPRAPGAGHADLVSALVLAIWDANVQNFVVRARPRSLPSETERMTAWWRREAEKLEEGEDDGEVWDD